MKNTFFKQTLKIIFTNKRKGLNFIKKDIENKAIVWFEKTNQYLVLEKKTAEIISQILEETPLEKIGEKIATDLEVPIENAMDFVKDINKKIVKSQKENSIQKQANHPPKKFEKSFAYKKYYKIYHAIFLFEYETEFELDLVHPKFAYLEIDQPKKIDSSFQIFSDNKQTYLLKNNSYFNYWSKENIHYLQGKVSMLLVEELYEKSEDEWMGVYHASALGNGKKSILFLGDSGNGKSTSLALLQAHGFDCIADDFVPVAMDKKVYRFPSAISVKKTSWEMLSKMYPNLNSEKEYHFSSHQKTVRYLPPTKTQFQQSFECNSFFFIRYQKEIKTTFQKISNIDAFEQLLPDSWVSQNPKNVTLFLDWFSKTKCYSLTYSNNKEMIDIVTKLFEDDL